MLDFYDDIRVLRTPPGKITVFGGSDAEACRCRQLLCKTGVHKNLMKKTDQQILIFCLCWLAYFASNVGRLSYSAAMVSII